MLDESVKSPVLTDNLLFVRSSMVAAGVVIVVWKSINYFDERNLSENYIWLLLTSFLAIINIVSIYVYVRAKSNNLLQSILTFLVIPVFIIVFLLAAAFLSEMFYGGSGYHGEYMFPLFK